jgi:peptidoglycan/xylan/chitin deacetylase (PgdA/CDA1 family)
MSGTGGVILLYHRVVELPTDPQRLCVSPARLQAQLKVMNDIARPISLDQMAKASAAGEPLPDRSVGVTFDDGYWDNLHNAKPLLTAAQVPATVFATAGHTGTMREFFWDELDRILLQPNQLPGKLALTTIDYAADLGDADNYGPADFERHSSWNIVAKVDPTPRQKIYRELCTIVVALGVAMRARVMEEFRRWAGVTDQGRPSHRMMTVAELKELADGPLVRVGGHTRYHPRLSVEDSATQSEEVRATVDGMAGQGATGDILGDAPGFSYPFGGRRDYSPDTVQRVKEAGYAYACSNFNGQVTKETDRFQLPRFIVRDWDGDEFAQRLESFFNWQPSAPAKAPT